MQECWDVRMGRSRALGWWDVGEQGIRMPGCRTTGNKDTGDVGMWGCSCRDAEVLGDGGMQGTRLAGFEDIRMQGAGGGGTLGCRDHYRAV